MLKTLHLSVLRNRLVQLIRIEANINQILKANNHYYGYTFYTPFRHRQRKIKF